MSEPTRKLSFKQRARSLPHRHNFHNAILWATILYLILAATVTALICFIIKSTQFNAFLLIGLSFLAVIIWLLGFFSRKKANCPLCKGTPLLDSRASKHVKAVRLWPLNYGTTNILRAITTRRLRCHFCGTPFDMLKNNLPPNH